MGKRGPKRTPTALMKLRRGKAIPGRKNEPELEPEVPSCPMWLDPEAKAEWKRITPQLSAAGVLSRVDRGILAGLCQNWADYHRAVKMVQSDGEIQKTEGGFTSKNPWVTLKNEAWGRYFKAVAVLGLSPSARAGLHVQPKKEKSGKDRFFKTG